MKYCQCHSTMTIKAATSAFIDEVKEFIAEPTMDELSDIAHAVNRFAGALKKVPYTRVVVGDKLHKEKIDQRMAYYGCIRSPRHLVLDQCPSILDPKGRYIEVTLERVTRVHNIPRGEMRFPQVGIRIVGALSGIYRVDEVGRIDRISDAELVA